MNQLKSFIAALVIAVIAGLGANAAGWQPSAMQPGEKYYIYNVGAERFLNADNDLQPYATTVWTVGEDGTISSADGHYVAVIETHEDKTVLGITTSRTYTFVASTSLTDPVALSNIEAWTIDETTGYLLGNLIEDTWTRPVIGSPPPSNMSTT